MFFQTIWILKVIFWFNVGIGYAKSDKCISRSNGGSVLIKPQYCWVTRRDVQLSCTKNEVVVVSGLQLAIKNGRDVCTKRVLSPESTFCCYSQETDILYDSDCLQNTWNKEDKNHYQMFVDDVMRMCSNTSQCVLNGRMFAYLQREIPTLRQFSSYFQVLYRCIKVPTNPMRWCSSQSVVATEVHLQGAASMSSTVNKTCTCRVWSQKNDDVIVTSVDVRNVHKGIFLKSDKSVKNLSSATLPAFGFREMFSAPNLNISVSLGDTGEEAKLWLRLSGSNSENIKVTCGETKSFKQTSSVIPKTASTITTTTVFWGHWPLVYIGAGSLFTIVIVACIFSSFLVCRKSSPRRRCRYPCPGDFHQDPYAHPYATVLDENPNTSEARVCNTEFRSPQEWRYDHQCVQSSSSSSHGRPPSFPPPNVPGKISDASSPSNQRSHMFQGKEYDVSNLEAFLKC